MEMFIGVFGMSRELRKHLCNTAKVWKNLGVKYEHRGTTRNGCDCTGLIIGILQELGYMKDYKLRIYPIDWNLHSFADNHIVEELSKVADKIAKPDIGDLVLFYFGKCVAHSGIVIEDGLFIHIHQRAGKCIVSSLWNSSWTKRIVNFYRLNEDKLNE